MRVEKKAVMTFDDGAVIELPVQVTTLLENFAKGVSMKVVLIKFLRDEFPALTLKNAKDTVDYFLDRAPNEAA